MANLDGGPVTRFFRKVFSVRLGYDNSVASTAPFELEHRPPVMPSAQRRDEPGPDGRDD